MGMVEEVDEAAASLLADPEQTYEVAIQVAAVAERYLNDDAFGSAAVDLRDVFGTWVHLIHSYGGPDGSSLSEAEGAHRDIEEALREWAASGRTNPAAFASRWRGTVADIDTSWMERRSPLTRRET